MLVIPVSRAAPAPKRAAELPNFDSIEGEGLGAGAGDPPLRIFLIAPPLAFLTGGLGFGLGAPAPNSLPGGITDLLGKLPRGGRSSEGDGGGGAGLLGLLAISIYRRKPS